MNKTNAYIKITRPINIIFTFIVVLVSIFICSKEFAFTTIVFIASLTAALVAAGGNIINDYFDAEIDEINKPNRPIPSGSISKKNAVIYYLSLTIIALAISSFISTNAFAVVIITSLTLFFYSKYLKAIPLLGNIAVAFCTALAFLFGGIIAENIEVSIIPAIFAFLINLIREVLKDVEDIDGDRKLGLNTFPIKYGIDKTKILLATISIFLILSTFYPYFTMLYKIEYFIIALFSVNLPIAYFIKEISSNNILSKLSHFSGLLKLVMLFGLVAIYFGVN